MRVKISKMYRSAIAMLLTLCMVISMVPAVAFVATAGGIDQLKYVALGDSFTNGYGLDGYNREGVNVWGFLQEVPNSYPVKVAEHYGWDLTQLAMNGLRAEDVLYLLTYGSKNAYPGDDYTHSATLQHFADAGYANTAELAKLFQGEVKNADVISIQLGTGNFGMYIMERLRWHMSQLSGMDLGGEVFQTDMQKLLNTVAPEVADFGTDMYNDLMAILREELASSAAADMTDLCESMVETAVYSAIGFAYSYARIIDWINDNTDAEVILVGMPNVLDGMVLEVPSGDGTVSTINMGKYFGYLTKVANTYMAGIAATYDPEQQLTSNSSRDLKTYYAQPGTVEVLAAQIATGDFAGYSELEDRLMDAVRGTIMPLLKDTVNEVAGEYGLQLVDVTDEDLAAYAEFAAKWEAYVADKENVAEPATTLSNDKILSCAIYLAAEKGIIEAAKMDTLDKDTVSALLSGELDNPFADIQKELDPEDILDVDAVTEVITDAVMEDIMNNDADEIKEWILDNYETEIADQVVDWVNANKEDELIDILVDWAEDNRSDEVADAFAEWILDTYNDEIEELVANGMDRDDAAEQVAEAKRQTTEGEEKLAQIVEDIFNDETDTEAQEFVEQTYMDLAEDYVADELTEEYLNKDEVQQYIKDNYADRYMDVHMPWYASRYIAAGVTPVLVDALKNDETVMGLFHLFVRYIMSDSISCHPSAQGHAKIAKNIIAAYDGEKTAADATIGEVMDLLNKCYEKAYGYADQEGYINVALDALQDAINELQAIDLSKTSLTEAGKADVAAQIKELVDILEAAKALLSEADVLDKKTVTAWKALVAEAKGAMNSLIAFTTLKADDNLSEIVEKIIAKLEFLFGDATHGEYTIDPDSHYVALGDSSAVSTSYVDMLAAEMANISGANYSFTNLAQDGLMIQDVYSVLNENKAEIEKADLITIGFSSNSFSNFAAEQVMNLIDEVPLDIDWTKYVGEEGLPYIELVRKELRKYLADSGVSGEYLGIDYTEVLAVALESYVYSYIAYTYNLPKVIEELNAINPDALVIIVGMYNPLDGVVVELDGAQLAVGEYLQRLVNVINAETHLAAILTGHAIFVDAPAVEVSNTKKEMTIKQFLMEFTYYKAVALNPNQNGHTYIKDQILNALTIYADPVGLLGDADSNGVVDNFDSMLILQYSVGLIEAEALNLRVCDVNGDNVVDNLDSMLVLQYSVGIISVFPVEA